jgi:hypothetical protein
MKAQAEKLRANAAECALIRDLATDPKKRDLFSRLAGHLLTLAQEVERARSRASSRLQGLPMSMKSGDSTAPPLCKKCSQQMTFLVMLPEMKGRPTERIYRCPPCARLETVRESRAI